jgi:radical SAM superfamily enzyme YgiQ (UPF0313 family)
MQKNITLINPMSYRKYTQPPMGLLLLASILQQDGHHVNIVDNSIGWGSIWNSDVVGITAMTPDIDNALNIASRIKRYHPDTKIILGGAHATIMPEETLNIDIDTLVAGEGDKAILEVINNDIDGIYKSDTKVDVEDLPLLAYNLVPHRRYSPHPPHGRKKPFMAMITSRGCPYTCSYCSKAVFGNKYRAQSADRVGFEIDCYTRRYGVKEIAFYDDVFTLDKDRIHKLCDVLLTRNIKIAWTCESRVDLVDYELLKHMKEAGCYSIAYGIESGNQCILDALNKRIRLSDIEQAVKDTRKAKIEAIGYFMLGAPNETLDTMKDTVKLAIDLKLDYAQFSKTVPFPGTRLYEEYGDGRKSWSEFQYTQKTDTEFIDNNIDTNYQISNAYRRFYLRPSYIWQRLSGIRNIEDINIMVKGLSMLGGM